MTFSMCIITEAFQGTYERKSPDPSSFPLFPAENPIMDSQETGARGESEGWRLGMATELSNRGEE